MAIFLYLWASSIVHSADIVIERGRFGTPVLVLNGEILKGDFEKFKRVSRELIQHRDFEYFDIYLESLGGDVLESMRIGRLLRSLLARTHVIGYRYFDPKSVHGKEQKRFMINNPEKAYITKHDRFVSRNERIPDEFIGRCYSSCVLIFYSGVRRDSSDNGYFRDSGSKTPVIGIHRPYFNKEYYSKLSPVEAKNAYKKLEGLVKDYLVEMGASNLVIERMFKTASNDVDLLLHDEFKVMYERKEPFLEEWLIAKCGSTTSGEGFLTKENSEYYRYINDEKFKAARHLIDNDTNEYIGVIDGYFPEGSDKKLYEALSRSVRSHNFNVHACTNSAVMTHQKLWSNSFPSKRN